MEKTQVDALKKTIEDSIDESFTKKLEPLIGDISTQKAREVVEKMKMERTMFGRDITLLSDKQKKDFVRVAQAAAKLEGVDLKANEALIEEQDNRGGYLVSREVADAILRIAASVGTIMSQAMKWPMKTDELAIPNYTGSYLTGAYLGVDVAGTVTGITFGQAVLIAKKWQLAFVVGNDLLADASVQLADWLLALGGEALANMIDQQGFLGGSGNTANGVTVQGPFLGILGLSIGLQGAVPGITATQYYAGNSSTSGYTKFSNDSTTSTLNGFDVLRDSSNMIGLLEESILDGAAFYCHRTVWAALRTQKDQSGNFILPFGGLPSVASLPVALGMDPLGGPVRPAGQILGFPVYTNRWLPPLPAANAATANTPFIIFGNLKATAFGDKGEMRVAQFESGSFGGKEVALADQRGIVYKHRHAFTPVLPQAFVIGQTSVS
jgi:HK97 family phage major capsid protein